MPVNLKHFACGPLHSEHRAYQVAADPRKPTVMLLVIEDIKNRLGKLLRIADTDQLSGKAVNHHFGETTHTPCDGRHGRKERFDHATAILRSGNVDRYVEIRPHLLDILLRYVARHQYPATSNYAGAGLKAALIPLGACKGPTNQDTYDVWSLPNHRAQRIDYIFMSLKADPLP
jgi:hypothetical protein